jgi:hypothetical protein
MDLNSVVESEQYPERFVFINAAAATTKSKSQRLPSRLPITIDVLITGTATVKLYASNIEDDGPAGTKWGAAVRTISASEKIVIEGEPWLYWMAEVSSYGSGAVTVVGGA